MSERKEHQNPILTDGNHLSSAWINVSVEVTGHLKSSQLVALKCSNTEIQAGTKQQNIDASMF